jgi:hypothetical protein
MLSCERNSFAILTKIARQFVQGFVVEFMDINANIDRGNECAMKRLREHVVRRGMSRQCYNPEILSISGALHESVNCESAIYMLRIAVISILFSCLTEKVPRETLHAMMTVGKARAP